MLGVHHGHAARPPVIAQAHPCLPRAWTGAWTWPGAGRQYLAMLNNARIASRLPAQDLARARAWYSEKLGLQPSEERAGGLLYRFSNGEFGLFASQGKPTGEFTQMGWEVDDIEAVVCELRRRGVVFEEVDVPGLRTIDGIADIEGNYPSKGRGERAAWFRDCEGNLLGIGQPVR
jgi:predicted enzyme related to lactoylglutathione lyase